MGGWLAGATENKAISASNQVEVEVEAELGKNSGVQSIASNHPRIWGKS